MIAQLTGQLRQVDEDRVHLACGPVVYELLVSAADVTLLEAGVGQEMTFHTIFYLQGDSAGGNLEPRLIGFINAHDKRFFEKFITVKGIGPKKALKAIALPVGDIAHAIENRDARYLVALPEIGKRTAEQIIAELAGKVAEFATSITILEHGGTAAHVAGMRRTPAEEDAIQTLMALGERRLDAEHLLDRARQNTAGLKSIDAYVREMLRMRTVRA